MLKKNNPGCNCCCIDPTCYFTASSTWPDTTLSWSTSNAVRWEIYDQYWNLIYEPTTASGTLVVEGGGCSAYYLKSYNQCDTMTLCASYSQPCGCCPPNDTYSVYRQLSGVLLESARSSSYSCTFSRSVNCGGGLGIHDDNWLLEQTGNIAFSHLFVRGSSCEWVIPTDVQIGTYNGHMRIETTTGTCSAGAAPQVYDEVVTGEIWLEFNWLGYGALAYIPHYRIFLRNKVFTPTGRNCCTGVIPGSSGVQNLLWPALAAATVSPMYYGTNPCGMAPQVADVVQRPIIGGFGIPECEKIIGTDTWSSVYW